LQIRFSVIIPLYNKEKEIVKTLESVFAQNYKPDEVIVVNDGSTDKSAEVVQKAFGDQVRLVQQQNCGVSTARNRGIKEATNEYLCFLDADDFWEKNFLEEIGILIMDFPEAVVYSTSHKMIDEKGKIIKSKVDLNENYRGYIDNFIKVFKNSYGIINSSSVCIKKSINPLFPIGEKKGEDICTWIELSLKGKFAFSKKALSIYKLDASNRSSVIHKEPIIPCQLKWIYNNRDKVTQEIIDFVHKNMLVTCYGMALEGNVKNVKAIVDYMKTNGDKYYLFLLPSLFLPHSLLSAIKKIRRAGR